ncbi:MAG TPA: DUF2142 domain-containing protein [Candidatus Kapabacteria bacterium]|nr:DUF2142 domain-containing protein [Candidatus Kapabacteria bacterium]
MDILTITYASLALFVSATIWYLLYRRNQKKNYTYKELIVTILTIGLATHLIYVIFTPLFWAPDAQSHFNFVKYLSEHYALPIHTVKMGDISNEWEYYQPPLYYIILAPFYKISTLMGADLNTSVKILRITSVFFWFISTYFSIKFIETIKFNNFAIKILTITIFSLLPTYIFISSTINNDNLIIVFANILLYLSTRESTKKNAILMGVILGLAILTKLLAAIIFVYFGLIFLYKFFKKNRNWNSITNTFITIAIGIIFWIPMIVRNLIIYGSLTAADVVNVPYYWDSIWKCIYSSMIYLQISFWSIAGMFNDIGGRFGVVGGIIFLFSAFGYIKYRKEVLSSYHSLERQEKEFLITMILTIITNLGLVAWFAFAYAQAQGRYLLLLLAPISLIIAYGFNNYKIFRRNDIVIHIIGVFLTYNLLFASYCLSKFSMG